MNGFKIKFNGIDRLYNEYSWRISSRAKEVWKSGNMVSPRHTPGSFVDRFENLVAKYTDRKYAVAVGSGTDALYFALRAKGIGANSRVVCPAVSYLATAEAIKRTGAKIIFVDVDESGLIGEIGDIKVPDAVVYVNLFGNLADYKRLQNYCDANKIPLIEDAAQSLGSTYYGIQSGKLGNISSVSFAPSKPLPCFGNAGMVLTDDINEATIVRGLRYHATGTDLPIGYNSCMANDHANILSFLISKYKKLLEKTKNNRKLYEKRLHDLGIKTVTTQYHTDSNNHKLVIKVQDREGLRKHLASKGIETQVHYISPIPAMAMFRTEQRFFGAENFCTRALSLPIHPFLSAKEINYICDCVGDFYGL